MKRMKILVALLLVTFAVACGQADKTFNVPVRLNGGFYIGADPNLYLTLPSGGVADWNTLLNKPTLFDGTWASLTGKPLTFAPSAHNHDALYKAIGYVPSWAEVTGKPPLFSGSYLDLTNKPTLFSGSYVDLTDKPESVELADAILSMSGVKLPVLTTAQIDALTPTVGLLVYDNTLNVLKIYTGVWKVVITNN